MSSPARSPSAARQRIVDTAYELFSQNGIRPVGIDRIIAEAGVAKMTLYRHFPAKIDLAVAFLDLRGERWTRDWLQSEIDRQAASPRDRPADLQPVDDLLRGKPATELWGSTGGLLVLRGLVYGGIMGMMTGTGLAAVIAEAFVAFSTHRTLPFWSFISSNIISLFVPSGGGHWAVQGPFMVPAAVNLQSIRRSPPWRPRWASRRRT